MNNKNFPECQYCLYGNSNKNEEPFDCLCNQLKYSLNESVLSIPFLKLFADPYLECSAFVRDFGEWRID